MDVTILKKLGLSDKEIKIYLALLEFQGISVRGLAQKTGLNRGTVYDILKNLKKVGLANLHKHKTKQSFSAEDPEKILLLVENRQKEIEKIKQKALQAIPELKSLQNKEAGQPVTKFFEEKKGIKIILQDVLSSLKKGQEYFAYSAKSSSDDLNTAYPNFTQKRIKKGIKVKVISLAKGGGLSGLDQRKWLDSEDKSATFIIIYANKCAFISRDSLGNPLGVIIENQMIYKTQKLIFLQLWKFLGSK